jgi:membrane protein DedA with SNARE-associated domain
MSPIVLGAIISVSSGLGYALPAVVGLESMGVPSPGETALILAAVLASQGKLNVILVLVIGVSSAIIGDNIGYWLGRWLGQEVLERPGPFQKRRKLLIASGNRFFEKHGGKAVFLARWVALVRVAAAWLAGINRMPFLHFFAWNALGGITWGTAVVLVGYYGGHTAADAITHYGLIAAVVIGAVIIAVLAFTRARERRAHQEAEKELSTGAGGPKDDPPASAADQSESDDSDQSDADESGSSSSAQEFMQ